MKLLFLDIDGVIWTQGGVEYSLQKFGKEVRPSRAIDPVALALVGYIVKKYDFKVVISSSWRGNTSNEEFQKILGPIVGAAVIGATPYTNNRYRGSEIKLFLDGWNEFYRGGLVEDFIILDDDRDMNPYMGHLFCTDAMNGFTFRDVMAIERYYEMPLYRRKLTITRKVIHYNLARWFWLGWWWFSWKVRDIKNLLIKKEVDKPLPPA